MKKVRIELGMVLTVDVDEQDEEKAMADAVETIRSKVLEDHGNNRHVFEDDDVYMANFGITVLDCEEVDYE